CANLTNEIGTAAETVHGFLRSILEIRVNADEIAVAYHDPFSEMPRFERRQHLFVCQNFGV
ncbi:MAG TPA: hypothetical protein VLW75_07450, partial [Rhizomicrobium sp.]|nr:hypothetical protein [Rhizomicrobium sp.]